MTDERPLRANGPKVEEDLKGWPSYVRTDLEKTLYNQRERQRAVINAMQARRYSRLLPLDLWRRRAWRARHGPFYGARLRHPIVAVLNIGGWLRWAHDCQDPAQGCSCTGGFLFP